jgi:hypothetical protein
MKVNGVWRYVYRAVDQDGQVIDVLVSARRDADAARRFFRRALTMLKVTPVEVVTDAAAVYPRVLDELLPAAWHHVERWANNRIEADHSQLKHRVHADKYVRAGQAACWYSWMMPPSRSLRRMSSRAIRAGSVIVEGLPVTERLAVSPGEGGARCSGARTVAGSGVGGVRSRSASGRGVRGGRSAPTVP